MIKYSLVFLLCNFLILKSELLILAQPKTVKTKLKNGITLIHRETKPLPIVSLYIFLRFGSVNDPEEKLGLTNLTQELLMKGTKTRSSEQIATEIESMGGSIDTSCSEDYSQISLSITKEYFEKGLELLSDIFLNPTFPEEELQKEKIILKASIRQRQDRIFDVAFDLLRENLYGKHPYANLTCGTERSVDNITREDIINWHKRYYGRENVLFVVVGNLSLNRTKKLIEKYFAKIPPAETPKVDFPKLIPEYKEVSTRKKFEQSYLMFGFVVPEVSSDSYPKLKLLNAYLGGGMSSLLFQELREKAGLGYEVNSFYPSRKDKSHFVIYIGLDASSISIAKEKIKDLLNKLKTELISDERLKEIKNYLIGTYTFSRQTNSQQAWYLGWWEILGKGYEYDEAYIAELNKVTKEELRETAEKYLTNKFVVCKVLSE